MTTPLNVLVAGATGNQGGALIRALLAHGHQVHGIVRDAESASTQRLTAQGVNVVPGDLDDPAGLMPALRDVDTFYLMGSPTPGGVEAETRQGIALADAASSAGVGHLVYGSVANADLDTGIPHFDSKYRVEQHIHTLAIPFTITAPVYFMDNALAPWSLDALKAGSIMMAMSGERALQQVSVKNIGEFVAAVISRRDSVFGQRIDFAGDELTPVETAAGLSRASGHRIEFQQLPIEAVREQSGDMAAMFEWFDRVGYNVDIAALRAAFTDVDWQTFDQWCDAQDWSALD